MDESSIISSLLSEIISPDLLKNDACVFGDFVITKDVLVEGVHFFSNSTPKNLAKKALRVNLSDIASMGAVPVGYFLGIVLNKTTKQKQWLKKFVTGLKEDHAKYNIKLLGGDTVIADGNFTISITMIGKHHGVVLQRDGAKVGDLICVSGCIGDSYLGLLSYKNQIKNDAYFKSKYDLPDPKIQLGKKITDIATSCIDISDGLLHDVNHIAQNSGVMMEVCYDAIPTSSKAEKLLINNPQLKNCMITAGDDYELLFTIPPCAKDRLNPCDFYAVGHVKQGCSIKVINKDEQVIHFKELGFIHK